MPEGSPMVMRMGSATSIYWSRRLDGAPGALPDFFNDSLSANKRIGFAVVAHLDIGVALQVAQIAPRQSGDLALEQLVFHLLAGGHHIGGLDLDPLVATPDQFDTGFRHERRRRLAGLAVFHRLLDLGAQLGPVG